MKRCAAIFVLCLVAAMVRADHGSQLARAAVAQVGVTTIYDSRYVKLQYPGGDLPKTRGVCADVIVRAFREIGVDLQVLVHEDMRRSFGAYPKMWGLRAPDANIDHRRVPNLMKFSGEFETGDVVAWRLPNGLYHIGIVSGANSVVHNIGYGAKNEDVLHAFRIIGHYRW